MMQHNCRHKNEDMRQIPKKNKQTWKGIQTRAIRLFPHKFFVD